MNVYKNIAEIGYDLNTVITVGTFDGVHKGHQNLINKLLKLSEEVALRHILITIHPHPQIVLKKENKPKIHLLNTIDERIELFDKNHVKNVLVLEFTQELAETSAKDFIVEILHKNIGFKKILVGYDHNFGRNREGNKELLQELSVKHNFELINFGPYSENDNVISSSKIRNMLLNNEIEHANQMLGYVYNLTGKVFRGENRGEKIGFPTANIYVENINKLLPANGVYFVYSIIDNVKYFGMANIGIRPTVSDTDEVRLEVHYFGINKKLYDKRIRVHFVEFIRKEVKFDSLSELVLQLQKDKEYSIALTKKY